MHSMNIKIIGVQQTKVYIYKKIKLKLLKTNTTIYMQSNKIHKVFLMSEFYSALMLARHVSDLTGPSSGAFLTSCICRFGMW